MDIKDLNKSQLLLLAILISFVVSIATGITTVTLLEQAPDSVTTPITRVVRQTVETVVPVESKTVENTVIIKEEDLVVDAISKNQSSYFIVSREGQDVNNNTVNLPAGSAFAVADTGLLVADGSMVTEGAIYHVENNEGVFQADFKSLDESGFALLQINDPVHGNASGKFEVATFGAVDALRTGQKLIVLGESVSSFIYNGNPNIKIQTSEFNAGGMVLNLDGEVLGIALMGDNSFVPGVNIQQTLIAPE